MANLYESYTTDVEAFSYDLTNVHRNAQGFTPSVSHTITSVKLYLRKFGSPPNGDITVSIKASDINGLPTGGDLALGVINSSTVSVWAWHEIALTPCDLNAGTTYCIVFYFANGDANNYIDASLNNGNPYASGVASRSADSGASWFEETGFDFHFQDWGVPVSAPRAKFIPQTIFIN